MRKLLLYLIILSASFLGFSQPSILDATWSDQTNDGNIDRVVLTFDVPVDVADGLMGADGFDAIVINDGVSNHAIDPADYTVGGTLILTLNFTADQITGTGITGLTVTYDATAPSTSLTDPSGPTEMANGTGADVYTDLAFPVFLGASATSNTVVQLRYSEIVTPTFTTAADWTATGITVSDATQNAGDNSIVDLTVGALNNTAFTTTGLSLVINDDASDQIIDGAFNNAADISGQAITDGQLPVLQSVTAVNSTTLELQYSETVTPTWNTAGDWTATGMTSTGAAQNADNTIVDLSVNNLNNTGFSPNDFALMINDDVSDQIIDAAGNNAANVSGVSVADAQPPVFISASAVGNTLVQLQYSENVTPTFTTAADWTATGITVSNAQQNAGDNSIVDLTVGALANTAFTAPDLALVINNDANDQIIDDVGLNAADISGQTISDGQLPVLQSVTAVNSTTLELQYSETVTPTWSTAGDWTATGMTSTGAAQNADNTIVDLSVNNLSNTGFSPNDFALIINDDGSDQIIDGAGNNAADVSGVSVVDAQLPVFVSGVVDNANRDDVVITFSEDMSSTDETGFSISVGGSGATIIGFAVSNTDMTFTLSADVTAGQAVTITYDGTGDAEDTNNSNALAAFGPSGVANNVNNPPAFAGLDATPNFTEDGSAIILDNNATISDVELDALNSSNGDYDGATLTIERNGTPNTDDVFSFADGSGITFSANTLIKNSQVIASFTQAGGTLTVAFTNANGEIPTTTNVSNILQQIEYSNTNDNPPANVTLDFTINDGLEDGGIVGVMVSITPNDDSPSFAGLDATPNYTEDGSAVVLDNNATVIDPEFDNADDWTGGSITIVRNSGADTDDVFGFQTVGLLSLNGANIEENGNVVATFDQTSTPGELVVTFVTNTDFVSASDADAILQNITYSNPNQDPAGPITLDFTVDDGNSTGTGAIAVTLTPVNDPPTSSANTVTAEEDVTYTFINADFAFTDAVEGDAFQQVYIIALPTDGTLQYNGVDAVTGTGTSYTDRTLFTYLADADLNGTSHDSFTFQVVDNGGTSNGGDNSSVTYTMTIDVTAINDEPTIDVVLSGQNIGSGDGAQSILLFIDPATDITFGPADESGQSVFDFVVGVNSDPSGVIGSIDILNTGELQYTPNSQTQGTAVIDVQVQDNGGTAGTGADNTSPVVQFSITVTDNEVPEIENPASTDLTPADGATGVAATNALQIVFDEDVAVGTGNITVYDASNDGVIATIDVTDGALVSVTGSTVDIDLENNWLIRGEEYYVQIDATAFDDLNQGLSYPGISNTSSWRFTMATAASSGPNLLATIPANGETNVLPNQPIIFIYDEKMEKTGTNNREFSLDIESSLSGPVVTNDVIFIDIDNNADSDFGLNGTIANSTNRITFDLAENPAVITSEVSGSGSPLPYSFAENTFYSFELDANTFQDSGGNDNSATGKFYFQTVLDGTPPNDIAFVPANGGNIPASTTNISIQFDEDVVAGSGNIEIYANTNPDYLVATIPSDDGAVTYNPGTFTTDLVIIDISGITLSGGINYYVNIDAGAFEDATGNQYTGISDELTWNFNIDAETNVPVLVSRNPADNASNVDITTDFVLEFDEPVFEGAGTVSLILSATNTVAQTLDASSLDYTGNLVTMDFGTDLDGLTQYYITVPSGVIQDNGGTVYGGFTSTSAYNITTESGTDVTGPVLLSSSPTDTETDVAVDSDFTIVFNEPVSIVSGNIDLDYSGNGAGTDVSIDVTTATITSNSVSVPAGSVSAFPYGETVDVTINAGIFDDQFGNSNLVETFSFDTEADLQAPIITPVTPADDATGVGIANPSLNFTTDENVTLGSNVNIRILRVSDLQAIATLNTTSDAGSFAGSGTSSITMNFTVTLDEETEYYVQIPANAFLDTSPATNGNAAFGGTSGDWSFTTIADVTPPTLVITRGTVTNGDPDTGTNDTQVTYDLAFSEPIDDGTFAVGDITVNNAGVTFNALAGGDLVNSGDDQNYTLTIDGISGDGTLSITVGPNINDQAAAPNAMTAAEGPSTAFTFDQTPPTAPNVSIASDNATATQAVTTDVVTLTFNVDDDLAANPTVTFSSGGSLVTGPINVGGANPNYTSTYTVNGADEDGNVTFTIDFTDDAGNAATQVVGVAGTGAGTSVNVDNITPTITINTLETTSVGGQTLEGVLSTNGDADESTDDLSISVTIDGGGPIAATNDLDGTWSLNVAQGIGIYDIDATVTDLAGNSSTNLSEVNNELQVGDIAVTAPSLGNICIDGPAVALGDIILTESKDNDFKVGTNRTLFIDLPSDFEFNTGATVSDGGTHNDITGVSFYYLGTQTLRIQFNVNSVSNSDVLRIQGIEILATGSTPNTQNATFTNGTASIFDLTNGDVAATLTSVSAPAAPDVRTTNAFGTIITEGEVGINDGTQQLYNDGTGTAFRWYDYAGNQISTLQNPTLTQLTAGGPNNEVGFDITTAGLYTLYASTINAAGCESPWAKVNIFVYDRTLNPNQTSFDASDEVGTTITIVRDQTDYNGTFSGPGLTNITENATEETTDFIPKTAGVGTHPVNFEINNLTTGQSYDLVTTLSVSSTASVFATDPPNIYCNTSDEAVTFEVSTLGIPGGFYFYEVGLYNSGVEVVGAFTEPAAPTLPISAHRQVTGWGFDPTDAGAGNYVVRRYIVPNGSIDPEADKFEFVNESFTVNEIPTVQLSAISDLCETDDPEEIFVRVTTGGAGGTQTPSDFLITYTGPNTPAVHNTQFTVSGNFLNPADPLDTVANGLTLADLDVNYPVGDYQVDYISESGFDPLGNGCVDAAFNPQVFSILPKPDKPFLSNDLSGIGGLDDDDNNGNGFVDDYFLEFCAGDVVPDLVADDNGGADSIRWYTDAAGTSLITTSAPYNTLDIESVFGTNVFNTNVSQNLYFALLNGTSLCESDLRRVNIAVRDFPSADIVDFPASPSGSLFFDNTNTFYFEYCADPGEDVSTSLDDVVLYFSDASGGDLPASGLFYFEIFDDASAATPAQIITHPAGGALAGRTLDIITDLGIPATASSDVDIVNDTTIYVRRVIYDRVSLDGTEEFAGCEEQLYEINISINTRAEAPGAGEGEFSGNFVLDNNTDAIEYYMCRDEQFPVRITDPQVGGSNYVYKWYTDAGRTTEFSVDDPFGERPSANELGVDVSTPGTYTTYTSLQANRNLATGFTDCEGPVREVNINVFDIANDPVVTTTEFTSEGTPTGLIDQIYNFCTDNGQLDAGVSFSAAGTASAGGRLTVFNWYVSNVDGDLGNLQVQTTNNDVTALDLSISGIANQTRYFLVTQTTDVIATENATDGSISNVVYEGCESGGYLVEINYGSIPTPEFTYLGITEGRGTTFDLGDGSNVSIASSIVTIRDASNNVVGTYDAGTDDVNSTTDEFTISTLAAGEYSVEYYILSNSSCDNVIYRRLTILDQVDASAGYQETFNSGDGGWFVEYLQTDATQGGTLNNHIGAGGTSLFDDRTSSWALKVPEGDSIVDRGSGDVAWVTDQSTRTNYVNNGENSYYGGEVSFVYSPSFDITGLERPGVSVWTSSEFNSFRDGVVLQYSVDDGVTWSNVGSFNSSLGLNASSGNNWYTNESITGGPGASRPGQATPPTPYNPNNAGWSQDNQFTLDGWIRSTNILTIPDGQPANAVRFRFALGATGSMTDTDIQDGFAFDDFTIFERGKVVLVEQFSTALSTESKTFGDDFQAGINSNETLVINYFTDFANDNLNEDVINSRNSVGPGARSSYYGVESIPQVAISGNISNTTDVNQVETLLQKAALDDQLFDIQLRRNNSLDADQVGLRSATFTFTSSSTVLDDASEMVSFRFVVVEPFVTGIEISKATSGGSELIYSANDTLWNVMRKALPDPGGYVISGPLSQASAPIVFDNVNSLTWDVNNIYGDSLVIIAYVQNEETQEIYQAAAIGFGGLDNSVLGLEESSNFAIYPNPADEEVTLKFDDGITSETKWVIFDQSGKEVVKGELAIGTRALTVQTADMPSGLYFIHLYAEDRKRQGKRIIIVH